MRIYLSSYRLGDHADALVALAGPDVRTAIIGNALDYIPILAREAYAREVYDPGIEMARLGFRVDSLDLRDYFGAPNRLESTLNAYDLVWVLGGNSFLLRKAMKLSGFDGVIRGALARDALVYGGFSAGAVVTTPTLEGIHLMDDPDVSVEGYPDGVDWSGLGLFPKCIVPHYASAHAEADAAEGAALYFDQKAIPFVKLRDGDVIVVNGQETDILQGSRP